MYRVSSRYGPGAAKWLGSGAGCMLCGLLLNSACRDSAMFALGFLGGCPPSCKCALAGRRSQLMIGRRGFCFPPATPSGAPDRSRQTSMGMRGPPRLARRGLRRLGLRPAKRARGRCFRALLGIVQRALDRSSRLDQMILPSSCRRFSLGVGCCVSKSACFQGGRGAPMLARCGT